MDAAHPVVFAWSWTVEHVLRVSAVVVVIAIAVIARGVVAARRTANVTQWTGRPRRS